MISASSRRILLRSLLLLTVTLGAGACVSSDPGMQAFESKVIYNKVNLRAETNSSGTTTYSTNYVGVPLLFPINTTFKVIDFDSNDVRLQDPKGQIIALTFVKKHNQMLFSEYMARTFAEKPVALPSHLTALEKEGIRSGTAKVGMTRQAVFLALGYPPANLNASFLQSSTMTYMSKRFDKLILRFGDKDRVTEILD